MYFIKELFSKIRERLYRLRHPVIFRLEEEYSDVLAAASEIEKRNVLVGTVRRREQLPVNLSKNFYHIPMNQLITAEGIEYVALYQSKHLFNLETDTNGIAYYGLITEAKQLKRSEITEIRSSSSEPYMRFEIEKWHRLSPQIIIREKSPKVFLRTSKYLLHNAKYTSELYCKTADEYLIHLGLNDIISDIYDGFEYNGIKVIKRGSKIKLTINQHTVLYSFKNVKRYTMDHVAKITEFQKKHLTNQK
ncbi:MAG: hypothetical protein IJP16_04260 [Clostridia bacterium]|nr:hypothetical protein [Clostridia bacterium]